MITSLQIMTRHNDLRYLQGIKDDRKEQKKYLVKFVYHGMENNEVGKTVLESPEMEGLRLMSYDFKLSRGLYDVWISEIQEILGPGKIVEVPDTCYRYKTPLMAGEKYYIKLKKEAAQCYGENGTRVRIATEIAMDSESIYYTVHKKNVDHIKYKMSFDKEKKSEFFIKGVKPEELEIGFDDSCFELRLV